MTLDHQVLFNLVNIIIIPFWIFLIFWPRHNVTLWLSKTYIFQLILSLVYIFLIVEGLSENSGGHFNSIDGIRKLFAEDAALLAGWIHYLIFDSFVGNWMVRDADQHRIPHLHILIPLVFTFLLGPAGFLMYILYKNVYLKKNKA